MSWIEMGGGSGDECVGEALPIVAVVVAWRRTGLVDGKATIYRGREAALPARAPSLS